MSNPSFKLSQIHYGTVILILRKLSFFATISLIKASKLYSKLIKNNFKDRLKAQAVEYKTFEIGRLSQAVEELKKGFRDKIVESRGPNSAMSEEERERIKSGLPDLMQDYRNKLKRIHSLEKIDVALCFE